jgi:hypothetical protein
MNWKRYGSENLSSELKLKDGRVVVVYQDNRGAWDGLYIYASEATREEGVPLLEMKLSTEMWGYQSTESFLRKVAEMALTLSDERKRK